MVLSRYQGHAWTPQSVLIGSLGQAKHPHSSQLGQAPVQSWALSNKVLPALQSPSPGKSQTALVPKQGTSDRSQTTEDREEGQGWEPMGAHPLAHRRDTTGW